MQALPSNLAEKSCQEYICKEKFFKDFGEELPKVSSLDDLIQELKKVFEKDRVNIELVRYLMESYKSTPADWKKYAKFDRYR